jgi:hypothetical protein
MAYTLIEFQKRMKDPNFLLQGTEKCKICKVPLQTTITGRRKSDKGFVCDDCWFDLLGIELDAHPICMPMVHH